MSIPEVNISRPARIMLFSYIVWVREAATFWKEPDVPTVKEKEKQAI